jgi:hypothetical protein
MREHQGAHEAHRLWLIAYGSSPMAHREARICVSTRAGWGDTLRHLGRLRFFEPSVIRREASNGMRVRWFLIGAGLVLFASACNDEPPFDNQSGLLTDPGGAGGAFAGAPPVAGHEGIDAGAQPAGQGGATPVNTSPACMSDADCDDENPCTLNKCVSDRGCIKLNLAPGRACGDPAEDACTHADTCNGLGVCVGNHTAAGAACGEDSECATAGTCDGQGTCLASYAPAATPCGDGSSGPCTNPDSCDGRGACVDNDDPVGMACGNASENECTSGDTCDGAGVCQSNNVPEGVPCADGVCSSGACECFGSYISFTPYAGDWQIQPGDTNLADFSCEAGCSGIPDHVIVFTAPSSDTFRFVATSAQDPVMAVFAGTCGRDTQLACNDDTRGGNSEIQLSLTEGDVVTVVISEQCEVAGGEGGLSIDVVTE